MDRYSFEDFVEKPFIYKGERKKGKGLRMNNALTCLLYIYLNSWNSQAVVNKVTATGIWRGSVALVLVTYFFTMPTIMLCLYLGKFLKHGSLSLHKCSPLLCGVGVMAFLMAFPLSSMMIYYPMAENIFVTWLVDFKASLPTCNELRKALNTLPQEHPCIGEQATYKCCLNEGLSANENRSSEECMQPRYPFYLLNIGVGMNCREKSSLFKFNCDYSLVFFFFCMVIVSKNVKGIQKLLIFVDKFYFVNIYMINLLTLFHFEVVLTGLYHYYVVFDGGEHLRKSVFDLVIMEVDHLSMSIPFLLMMGRLIDDSVPIDQLAIKLASHTLIHLFWQANEYIGVISVVATHYKVDYFCLHNTRRASLISLGVVPEFLSISITRILKYPAIFSYFFSIFLKKVASMVLFGHLLSYHLYFWEKRWPESESEKAKVRVLNMKGKFILSVVKAIVYIILILFNRWFNLRYALVPTILVASTIILAMQLCLFSIFLLALYSGDRFKSDVEAVTQRKLWPEYLTHLKLQPFLSVIYATIRLTQYYVYLNASTSKVASRDANKVTSNEFYKLYPIFYIIPVFLISATYIIYNIVFKFNLRVIDVSTDWGPVNKRKWRQIKPFHPGRNLVFYDKFYISHHMCFLDHVRIREVSMEQIENIKLFTRKWPCIFQTLKYKHHKKEIDDLITEAYTWGILATFENP